MLIHADMISQKNAWRNWMPAWNSQIFGDKTDIKILALSALTDFTLFPHFRPFSSVHEEYCLCI